MAIEIAFTWEVEDGYVGHGGQDAHLELSEDEARELLEDESALQNRMEAVAEEAFRQSITYTLSDNAVEGAMGELRDAIETLDEEQ
jgi:hypothetical protein